MIKIEQLLNEGVIRIELQEYANQAQQILSQASLAYTQKLPEILPPHQIDLKPQNLRSTLT